VSPRAALLAQATALRAQADALEVLADTLPDAANDDLLGVADCAAQYGVGRDALKRAAERGELAVTRGPRQRLQVRRSELRTWLESKPAHAAPREDWAA